MTLLYHLKADAKPFSSTIFRENIGITPSADEDWRWSVVAAKGIRSGGKSNLAEPLPAAPTLPLPSPVPLEPGMKAPVSGPSAPTAGEQHAVDPTPRP
jgi:hypothetical protein